MPKLREHTFDAGAIQINYAEGAGPGPPLVLLHGLAARWQVFGPLIPYLSLDWHLYALDLRGHGQSGRAPGHYRIPDFAGDVTTFVREQVARPTLLYGHSLGGWVALSVAGQCPDFVQAVVVGDTAIFPESIDPAASVSYLADMPIALRSLARSLNQMDPNVMEMFHQGFLTEGYNPEAILSGVSCPVLLLQADPELGALMTDADAERAMSALARAEHIKFQGLGHGLHVQDAGAVLAAVQPFLAAHSRRLL